MRWLKIAVATAVSLGTQAAAESLIGPWPVNDPTEVLVLGTPHLSSMEHMQRGWMIPLLDRLAAFSPKIIAIEGLSGPECFLLRAYEKNWPDTAASYCKRIETVAALGRTATGLDMPAAEAAAEEAVLHLDRNADASARRRLAALFASAGNIASAATQWLRLPPAERRAGDQVTPELASALEELSILRNENYWIAAALAARLGLDRVYPTDDHLSDRIQAEAPLGLGEALQALRSGERPPLARQAQALGESLEDGEGVLALYRFYNRRDVAEEAVRADMGKAFASAGQHGRRYVGWWETRNLRQIANIRAALARQPGQRALVIVGATHKPYFDAYLRIMHELRLVRTESVLGE